VLRNLFDRKSEPESLSASGQGARIPRHSGAWVALRKRLVEEPGLRVIDTGATSPNNINYLTNLGHSIFLADPVHDASTGDWQKGTDEDGKPIWDVDAYLNQTFNFSDRMFDVVLLWTTLDYLPEAFVAPVVDRLFSAMNPGGQVLAFFHTRDKGEATAYCRFHLTDTDTVEMQPGPTYPIQRAFTNRSIQQLFSAWSGFRQFLAKDALSEVLITR
jgi:hypothetical protein